MEIKKKIKKINILFLLKTGIATAVAILLAEGLGLLFSPSAGIITLLTIQNTKKETITIALKRIAAFVVAVISAYLIFYTIGYTAIAFGGFALLFVALCTLLGLKDGIAMNAVLTTHFLIEKRMDFPLILNEIVLLIIGMGIGIMINLIMPRGLDKIREEQNRLEKEMKSALLGLANMLRNKESCLIQSNRPKELAHDKELVINKEPEIKNEIENNNGITFNHDLKNKNELENKNELYDTKTMIPNQASIAYEYDFNKLDHIIEELLKKAYDDAGNTLLSNTKYLISYLDMRKLQIGVLKDISTNIETIPVILKQTFPLTDFLENISESFHEMNNVEGLLLQLREVQEHYRKEELPKTREEFEYRATLFQILKELEYFLLIKRNFVLQLEPEDRNTYWRKER
ncbi:MAG: aromatic acid exporter family protein [Mobilitalea sp.]